MHNFSELIERCSAFTLNNLDLVEQKTLKELEKSGATVHVKNLQMINLQKTFFIIGVFSFYESLLQERLNCINGFEEAKKILKENSEINLLEIFNELQSIINVLKHGKGRSYETLLNNTNRKINFKIKQPNDSFFEEGNVDEISSLIEIDNDFIFQCIEIINQVSKTIQKYNLGIIF